MSVYTTTENIKEYLDNFDLNNKTVLTVLSSDDHALECLKRGAKSVDLFDINIEQLYLFKLKLEIIKNHNFFYEFYDPSSKNYLSKNLYSLLKLDKDTKNYFDTLYFNNEEISKDSNFSVMDKVITYHKDLNSLNLKIFKNSLFFNKNINKIKLKKKYDYTLLSNISKYEKINKENLYKSLNPNGVIFCDYLYNRYGYNKKFKTIEVESMFDISFNTHTQKKTLLHI